MKKNACLNIGPSNPLGKRLADGVGRDVAQAIYRANNYNDFVSEEQVDAFIQKFRITKKPEQLLENNMFQKVINTIKERSGIIKKTEDGYVYTNNPQQEITRVSEVIAELKRSLGRQWVGEKGTDFYALKGSVMHEYLRVINKTIFENKPINQLTITKEVIEELKKDNSFSEKTDSFFDLTNSQFTALINSVKELKSNLSQINDEIKKNLGVDQDLKIFTEIPIIDTNNDIGGTIDLLVVFADGSVAVYDYKSMIDVKKSTQSLSKQMDWNLQISQYVNILKNNYGIHTVRQARVIPISVAYTEGANLENATQAMQAGFKSVGIYSKQNKSEFLKPFATTEESTGDANLDIFVTKLTEQRDNLVRKKNVTKGVSEKFRLNAQIKSLTKSINDVLVEKDVNAILENITEILKAYSNRVGKDEFSENHLPYSELVDGYHELEIYEDLPVFFKDQLKTLEKRLSKEDFKKTKYRMEILSDLVKNLKQDMLNDIISRSGGNKILQPGQGISNLGALFNGLDNWHIPIFQELKVIYTTASEAARLDTERTFKKIIKANEELQAWGKANGYRGEKLYELFINKKTGNLHDKYSDFFNQRFQELTKRARLSKKNKNYNPLTQEEKNWLEKYFEVDQKAIARERALLEESLNEEVKRKQITEKEKSERLSTFNKYLPSASLEMFYRGNSERNKSRVFVVPKKSADSFLSKEYQFIQSQQPLKNFHDLYTEIMEEYRNYYGADTISKNFLPTVHQDMTDLIARKGILAIPEILETSKQKFKIREQDEMVGTLVNGKRVKSIPLLYVEKLRSSLTEQEIGALEAEIIYPKNSEQFKNEKARRIKEAEYEKGLTNQSIDLTRSLMLFVASANEHIQLSSIEPMVEGLKIAIRSDKMLSKSKDPSNRIVYDRTIGRVLTYLGMESDIIQAFDKFVERLIYKQRFSTDLIINEKYSGNKMVQAAMNFFSTMAIGANLVLVASNYLTAKNNLWMLSKENRHFGQEDWNKALRLFGKQDERFERVYDYIQPTTRDYLREMSNQQGINFKSKFFRSEKLFIGHIKGDDRIDAALSMAIALKYRVDSDGRIKNPDLPGQTLIDENAPTVADSIKRDADGMTYIEGVTIEELGKFRDVVRKLGQRVKGMTNEKQKGLIYSTMVGSMFMHLRSWMPGMATTRFGRLEFDTTLGSLEQGRFALVMGEIIHEGFLPGLKEVGKLLTETVSMGLYTREVRMEVVKAKYQKFINENIELYGPQSETPLTIEDFISLHKAKTNSLVAELRVYLAFFALVQLLGGIKWDDEDEGNLFTWNAQQISRRALLEISFWLSPSAAGDIIKSPIPLLGLVERLTKIFTNGIVQTSYLVRGERNPRDTKYFGYYTLRTVPLVNQILNILRVFEPHRPARTTFDKVFFDED